MSHPDVRVRVALDAIATYRPGKGAAGQQIKLSSNENPNPTHPAVQAAIAGAAAGVNRYPDTHATALRSALAARHGVEVEQIVVGNGSCSLIGCLLSALAEAGDEIITPWRSFEAYPILIGVTGARPVYVPLTSNHRIDVEAVVAAVSPRTRAVLLCTPNNPTGTVLTMAELEYVMERVPGDALVMLDEAYWDFDDSDTRIDGTQLTDRWPNLIACRTFSKAYALAGLRVGYSVSSPHVAQALWKTTVPFSVNGLAQVATLAALGVADDLAAQVRAIVTERERVAREVSALGWAVPRSRANFLWFPSEEASRSIVGACEAANVSVRPFPDGVRVSIGTPADNSAFLAALATVPPR